MKANRCHYTASAILIMLFMLGCAYTPSTTELQHANYGAAPTQTEERIRHYFSGTLKDPDSLRIQFITVPRKDFYLNPNNFNTQFGYGWHVCAVVNAKNVYGGYVGARPYHFYFKAENIEFVTDASMNSGVRLQCNK